LVVAGCAVAQLLTDPSYASVAVCDATNVRQMFAAGNQKKLSPAPLILPKQFTAFIPKGRYLQNY
jgi:hypothetical protein